jgi:hypothetical protein
LVAERDWAGLREFDRLLRSAEQGRGLIKRCDRRSRPPEAIDPLLRVPVLDTQDAGRAPENRGADRDHADAAVAAQLGWSGT